MSEEKKTFFQPRTEAQIMKLHNSYASSQRNLIERIDDLNPDEDALIIRARIIPGRFFRSKEGELTGKQASLKAYHHGDVISLDVPKSWHRCLQEPRIPLKFRQEAFEKAFEGLKEDEINYIGYTTRVNFGDRQIRFFPFVWMPEGVKFFGYAEKLTDEQIKADTKYKDAERARREGVSVPVEIPSRTKKQGRYRYRLAHVPIIRGIENLATVLNLKPAFQVQEDEEDYAEPRRGRPEHDRWNFRYTWKNESEGSNRVTFYPHDVAAYLGIVKKELQNHNMTPMEMNPFALTSKHGAEIYKKLCNNILIYDPSLRAGKGGLRHLHIAEKSILWARAIKVFKHDDIAYWDPGRDGKLADYDWNFRK